MNSSDNDRTELTKAIEQLDVHDHLCLIYESREEQLAAAVPFIRIGLERGEQCLYIADDNSVAVVLDAMRAAGIDVDSASESGALAVLTKREAYLRQGCFDPDWMIRFLREQTEAAKAAGFKALRGTGEMTWALGGDPGVDRLIEYEAKLNYFLPESDILAICQYNRHRFPPEIIREMIYTHPLVIYGDTVCKNFYYVPPDEYLKADQTSREVDRLLSNILDRAQSARKTQLFRHLIDQSNDAIFLADPETSCFIDVNENSGCRYNIQLCMISHGLAFSTAVAQRSSSSCK